MGSAGGHRRSDCISGVRRITRHHWRSHPRLRPRLTLSGIQLLHRGSPHPSPRREERERFVAAFEESLNRGSFGRSQMVHPLLGERAGVRGTDASDYIVTTKRRLTSVTAPSTS